MNRTMRGVFRKGAKCRPVLGAVAAIPRQRRVVRMAVSLALLACAALLLAKPAFALKCYDCGYIVFDPNSGQPLSPFHGDAPSIFGGSANAIYGAPGPQPLSLMQSYMQYVWDQGTQFMGGDPMSFDEYQAIWDLNQPGLSVSFDDNGPSFDDNTDPASSYSSYSLGSMDSIDTSSDFPSDVPLPDPQSADSIAPVADNGSGDTSNVCCTAVGDPINAATGNLFEVQHDFVGYGPFPIRFLRFYNSLMQASAVLTTTELGNGWRGSYDSSVAVVTGQSVPTAVVVRPDGQSLEFTNPDGSQWVPADPTVRARLFSQSDSSGNLLGWTYVTADDTTETYSAAGQLLSIANRAGLTQTLAYNSSGQLVSVTDPFGHQMLFAYDAQGHLAQATDPAGGVYHYAYDDTGNLISVTYPDDTTRQYLYENSAFPSALTGLIDENGSRFATWTYDAQGRAVGSVLAGGVEPVSITYNSDGSSTVTDARGTVRQHSFITGAGGVLRPASTTIVSCAMSCPSITSSATYDANGVFMSGTDPNGNTTSMTYDARGLLTSRTEAVGTPLTRSVSITWQPVFQEPTQITFPDRTVTFTYDAQGNRTSQTITAGGVTRTWTYAYNAQGLMTQLTGPRTDVAQVWNFTYDAQGNLSSVQDPLGHVTRFTAYDAYGHPLSIIDPNGVTATFTYDARGRLISRTLANRTWTYQRDAVGQIIGITYPNGTSVALTYDAAHRLTDAIYSLGVHKHRVLTPAGDVTQVQLLDATNTIVRQESFAYDGLGHRIATTDANGQSTTFQYDDDGNLTAATDALGRTTTLAYDALNRPVSATDALGQTASIQYNPYDEPVEITAPNGAVTQYQYDAFREPIQEVSADRGTTSLTYTPAGLLATRTDARGVTARFAFDALNRLTRITYSSPSGATPQVLMQGLGASILSDDATFTYDQGAGCTYGIGRLCARQDPSGTESYAYDAFGQITQQTNALLGFSYSTLYAYDTGGGLMQEVYPDGRVVTYSRDPLERITGIGGTVNHAAAPILSSVQYRPDGMPASLTFGNGLTETRGYDPVGRLISQILGSLDSRSYGYDAVGDMTSKSTDAESDQFTYDALSRLTAEQRTQGTSTFSNAFGYDPNGNRLSETRNGTSIPYAYVPASNQLISVGASPITLDAAGNTTSDTDGLRQLYYSPAGRLQWVSDFGLPVAGYLYNALGERTGKLTLAGITLYHYDIFGRLISETTAGSQPSRDYVWAGGIPVAQIDHWVPIGNMLTLANCVPGSDGKIDWITYLHTDSIGTVRIGTDAAQNVVWRDDGEAFGETAPDQSTPLGAYPVVINLRNPGQYFDAETGFFYNGARYYDPQFGRYISSDPIGLLGGMNTYAYVAGRPLMGMDPSGTYEPNSFDQLFESLVEATDIAGLIAEYSPAAGAGALGYGVGTLINNTVCGEEDCSDRIGGAFFDWLNPQPDLSMSTPFSQSPQAMPSDGPPWLPSVTVCPEQGQ